MTLLAILIGLSVERFLGHLQELRRFDWFTQLAAWLRARFRIGGEWNAPAAVLLAVTPVVLAVGFVQAVLDDVLFGLPVFLFGILVLIYTLGPRDLDDDADAYVNALEGGDARQAQRRAQFIMGTQVPEDPAEQARLVADTLLVKANEAVFAVLFWFAVLGPVGAVLYRLAWVLKEHSEGETADFAGAAARLHGLLAWGPARLLALGYALVGSFEDAIHAWRGYYERWSSQFGDANVGILVCAGNGALHRDLDASVTAGDEAGVEGNVDLIRSVMGLIWRTLVLWVTVVALLTLAGWAS